MKKTLLFAVALCGMTSFAATEVKATFASLENGAKSGDYTVSGNCISGGTAWEYTDYITVIVKYSGLPTSGQQAIVTFHQNGDNDKVGIFANNLNIHGIWEGSAWNNAGSSIATDGTLVIVYAPNQAAQTGVKVYAADGTSVYDKGGLRSSSETFGDAINFGAKHDGSMKQDGFSVDALQILKGAAQASEITTLVAAFEEAIKPVADVISVNVQQDNICAQGTIQSGSTYKTLAGDILGSEWGVINAPGGSRDANTASGSVTIKGATVSIYSWAGSNWSFVNDTDKGAQGETQAASEYAYLNVFGSNRDRTKNDGWVGATNVPYEKYDVYIYFAGGLAGGNASTANGKFPGVRVASGCSAEGFDNTKYYKVAEDGTLDLTISSATQDDSALMWGSRSVSTTPLFGSNVIKIRDCTGDFKMFYAAWDSGPAAIQIVEVMTAATKAELSYAGDVKVSDINTELKTTDTKAEVTLTAGAVVTYDAALQVPTKFISSGSITLSHETQPDLSKADFSGVTGAVKRDWVKKGFGFNFNNNAGGTTTVALETTTWKSNASGNNGTNVAMSEDSISKITWTSNNVYTDQQNTGTILHGYLDDSAGVNITVSNIPFAEYAVIIYSTTDTENAKLSYKTVNGRDYTADGTKDVAKEGTEAWGRSRSSAAAAYGTNALRIVAQTSGSLVIHSANRSGARGCISAIQIVPYTTKVKPSIETDFNLVANETTVEDFTSGTVTLDISGVKENDYPITYTAVVNGLETPITGAVDKEHGLVSFNLETLNPGTVYRGTITLTYDDGKVLATTSFAVHAGEQQFVWTTEGEFWVNETATTKGSTGTWTEGISVNSDKLVVNTASGVTFTPNPNPDYVEKCDSIFTVSLSAAEAVDSESDTDVPEGTQGGVRLVKNGDKDEVKLEYLNGATWSDNWTADGPVALATAALSAPIVVEVEFHYKKTAEESSDYVKYTVFKGTDNQKSVTCTKSESVATRKISAVDVADGTTLAYLKGICELDKAVVADVEIVIDHDESAEIDAKDLDAAQAIADKMVVAISEEVAKVVDATTYRGYFKVVAKQGTDGKFHAIVEFLPGVQDAIEDDIEKSMEKVVAGFETGSAEIAAKPGLYYGVKRGEFPDKLDVEETTLATSDKVTITITKPDNSKSHFYRIIVSPTPAEAK